MSKNRMAIVELFANARQKRSLVRQRERGAALAVAVIVVAILAVVALTTLAFSSTEARIAGSDLQRTQTFYAAVSSLEKMTNDFSNLFRQKMNPTQTDLDNIKNSPPVELESEGFVFDQNLQLDAAKLNHLQSVQGLPNNIYPRVNIPDGPYSGLYASVIPYKMDTTATMLNTGTQIKLEREFNNYLVPLFQFGIYSNEDIEVSPGPMLTFNGRIHTNGNFYALRNAKFLNRITIAGEWVRNATRGGEPNTASGSDNVWIEVNNINVKSTFGSVRSGSGTVGGPFILNSQPGTRGYYPGSPTGLANSTWDSESVKPARSGTANRFGGQIVTNSTGAGKLATPLELAGNSPAEIIKRSLPTDDEILNGSRYHAKSQIRILIDDKNAGSGTSNAAGIPAGKGIVLPDGFTPSALGGGKVLQMISDTGSVSGSLIKQKEPSGSVGNAVTVRGVKPTGQTVGTAYIPPGAGIEGRILIEIVEPDGTTIDVTQEILSLGVTVGEPNGIVYLQRPLWAAFVQGSRDRTNGGFDLVNLIRNSQTVADGEISNPLNSLFPNRGFINMNESSANEDSSSGYIIRDAVPDPFQLQNQIVPINVYNVREGWYKSQLSEYDIYDRGITSVVEINMRNLARWLDGVYDSNLLAGTNAVSANIKGDEGYVVYISDRRGDKAKVEYLSDGTAFVSTNGIVDNEDIYGPNGRLDEGEDVIDFGWNPDGSSKKGSLQKDTTELPDSGTICCAPSNGAPVADRLVRARNVLQKKFTYFRRAVRLFDGERLSVSAAPGKLSPTKGITIASENMVYIWGNYNTTGITGIPSGGSTTNDGGYTGPQVPASIVCDAVFPLSKTWFDASSALYPEGSADARNMLGEPYRTADENLPSTAQSTSVRAGIIAGSNISSMTAVPGRDAGGLRRNGGIINYPRFLELWNMGGKVTPWNYTGSFVPLFNSTQALSQWENDTAVIYMPPQRNWSFDSTFLTPQKLPPGTPFFQYVQATGFRQSLK